MSLYLGRHPFVKPSTLNPSNTKNLIKSVRAYVIDNKQMEEKAGGGADCHAQASGHWIVDTPISTPMSVYEAYKSSRKLWGINAIGTMIVEVELYDTTIPKGYGISIGGVPGCYIVENHLSRFIEGQDIHNIELMWDQMFKSTVNYGRKGLVIQAISAVDLALWDTLGQLKKEPVYNLIGGKVKNKIPIYATTARPDLAQSLGFVGAKIPLPYGPGDGERGMKGNIDRLKNVVLSIKPNKDGSKYPIMIDCWMSLTVNYTLDLLNRIKSEILDNKDINCDHVKFKWIEEVLPPDDYDGYSRLNKYMKNGSSGIQNIMLTCGEHEYTRWGFRKLLENKCCDILQPDISWMGGLTEARRVVAMASAYDIPVIPHGSGPYSYHLQIAFPNCPMTELIMAGAPNADRIAPIFGNLFIDEPLPKNGYIELDENKYGFGLTLNPDVKLKRPFEHEQKTLQEILDFKTNSANDNLIDDKWFKKHSMGP
eukprot:704821_1